MSSTAQRPFKHFSTYTDMKWNESTLTLKKQKTKKKNKYYAIIEKVAQGQVTYIFCQLLAISCFSFQQVNN